MNNFYKKPLLAAFTWFACLQVHAQCANTVSITNTGFCLLLSTNNPAPPPPFPAAISYNGETYNLTGDVNSNSPVVYTKTGKTVADCFNNGIPSSTDLSGELIMGSYSCDYMLGKLTVLTVLPVNFSKFQAGQKGNTIQLDWANQAAANVIYYVIERSADGVQFVALDTIRVNGSSIAEHSWIDRQPLAGKGFYRIKAMSKTGDFQTSSTLILGTADAGLKINLVPNPVKDNRVNLIINSLKSERTSVTVTDFAGRTISNRALALQEGSNSISLELPRQLAKGTYLVRVSSSAASGNVYSKLLVVE